MVKRNKASTKVLPFVAPQPPPEGQLEKWFRGVYTEQPGLRTALERLRDSYKVLLTEELITEADQAVLIAVDNGIDIYCWTCFAKPVEVCRTKYFVHGHDEIPPTLCYSHDSSSRWPKRIDPPLVFPGCLRGISMTVVSPSKLGVRRLLGEGRGCFVYFRRAWRSKG